MTTVHKIQALVEVADTLADIEVIFTNGEEAEKAKEFLMKVEGLMRMEHFEVEPMTFLDFKDKLGERFDIIEQNRSLRSIDAANTVAA